MLRRRDVRLVPLAIVAASCLAAVATAVVVVVPDLDVPPQVASDFDINVWEPGQAIRDGRSPFRSPDGGPESGSVYPPAAHVATIPFTLLPYELALALWLVTLAGAVVLALRICGVTDWRTTAVALCSPPVLYGLAYANVSLAVVLGLALAWRWRDRDRRVAIVLGIVVSTRLFLWPLVVWLLLTGRRRAALESLVATLAVTAVGWAAVGFRGAREYGEVVRGNATEYLDDGVSVAAVAVNSGLDADITPLVAAFAGLGALVVAWRRRDDDLESFAWTVNAALFASPVVWSHYYALLLVPLALATPRLSRWWLLPYLTLPQLSVATEAGGRILDAVGGLLYAVATAVRCRSSTSASRPKQCLARPADTGSELRV